MGTWSQMCSCQTYCLQWYIPKWPQRVCNVRDIHKSYSFQIWRGNKNQKKKICCVVFLIFNFPISHVGKYLCTLLTFWLVFHHFSDLFCQIRLYFVYRDVHFLILTVTSDVAKQEDVKLFPLAGGSCKSSAKAVRNHGAV